MMELMTGRNVLFIGGMSEPSGWIQKGWDERVIMFNDFKCGGYEYTPHRLYQLHDPDDTKWKRKWNPQWRRWYRDSGADIRVREIDKALPADRQFPYDYERADNQFGRNWFTSSMSYILADMWFERPRMVTILGICLREPEYSIAVPGMVRAIKALKKIGVVVNCQYYNLWLIQAGCTPKNEVNAQGYAHPTNKIVEIPPDKMHIDIPQKPLR